jgi:hypothetical protein
MVGNITGPLGELPQVVQQACSAEEFGGLVVHPLVSLSRLHPCIVSISCVSKGQYVVSLEVDESFFAKVDRDSCMGCVDTTRSFVPMRAVELYLALVFGYLLIFVFGLRDTGAICEFPDVVQKCGKRYPARSLHSLFVHAPSPPYGFLTQ